jgi:hypothetical protein
MILYDKKIGYIYIYMDNYVSHFYQIKPTIKYYLVKIITYNYICYVFYILYPNDICIFLCKKILDFDFVSL